MRIFVKQELLLNGINVVLKACSSKTTMSILECILIKASNNQLTLVTNNLELAIESTMEADVREEGQIALEAKIFSEIIRKMTDEIIEISSEDDKMTSIIGKNSIFKIAGQSPRDFPEIPRVDKSVSCKLSQLALKDMIRQTIFSVSQEETRPVLTGEKLDIKGGNLTLVSVDGYRISYRTMPIADKEINIGVVIPGKTLSEISKILLNDDEEVTLYFEDKHIMFDLGDSKIVSRLLEGQFLDYEKVFSSDYETKISVDRQQLLMGIERAALISREGKKHPIKIELDGDLMIITSNTELGTAREEIPVSLEGKELVIAFNPRYLIEALKAIDEDKVCVQFISSVTPCIIKPEDGEYYKYLILPIRLNV